MVVGLPTVAILVALGLILLSTTSALIYQNRVLRARLAGVLAIDFTPVGAVFPETLAVHGLDGSPHTLSLRESAPIILMLFDTNCAVCEQNWPQWNRLIDDPEIGRQCFLISTRSEIPDAYIRQHPAMTHRTMVGISPLVASALHLGRTPQTILVDRGKVIAAWPNVLADADLNKIKYRLVAASSNN